MSKNMNSISGSGGGGKGKGGGLVDSPDNLSSLATAKFIDLISEGPIVGLVNNEFSIYLDGVPLRSLSGTPNYKPFQSEVRVGTQNQTVMQGFAGTEQQNPVGLELFKIAGPLVRNISDVDADAVRVTVAVSGLSSTSSDGQRGNATVYYRISVRSTTGLWVVGYDGSITGKTSSRSQQAHEVSLIGIGVGPFEVKVERVSDNSATALLINNLFWDAYTVINYERLAYPNSALVGVSIDARYFSQVPRRDYHVKGLLVDVPTNYNPKSRIYTGVWNGKFVKAYTNNPVWCYLDLLTNTRYGLGTRVTIDMVDKWNLYRIAKYCDQLVPTGQVDSGVINEPTYSADGTAYAGVPVQTVEFEPRFTLNVVLNRMEDAYRVLNNLTSVFRGMSYWAGGQTVLVQDAPGPVAMIWNNSNVIDGQFFYEGSSRSQRHTVVMVAWNDPAEDFKQKYEYVEDRDGIARYGIRTEEIVAFGCTSRSQARRAGLWLLYTEQNESDAVKFTTGLDSADVLPGEIGEITDNNRIGTRWGGRIVSSTSNTVTIDAPAALTVGSYTLSILAKDGTVITKTVTAAVAGSFTQLTVTVPFVQQPADMAVWTLASSAVQAMKVRVVSIKPTGPATFEITALEHNPSKFDAIELGARLDNPNYSFISYDRVPTVQNLVVVETSYKVVEMGTVFVGLDASWDLINDPLIRGYSVSLRSLLGSTQVLPEQSSSSLSLEALTPDTYTLEVKAVNRFGLLGKAATATVVITGKDTVLPANVSNLVATQTYGTVLITWNGIPNDLSYLRTEIRFSTEYESSKPGGQAIPLQFGAEWAQGESVQGELIFAGAANRYLWPSPGPGTYTITAKHIDKSGNESLDATEVTFTLDNDSLALQTATATIYRWDTSTPSIPFTGSTYTWLTGLITNVPADWNLQAATPLAGQTLWALAFRVIDTIENPASPITWSSASLSAIGFAPLAGAPGEPGEQGQPGVGTPGVPGTQSAPVFLYQWSSTQPSAPQGISSFTWSTGAHTAYISGGNRGDDGWRVSVPNNPGTPGLSLWVGFIQITALATATSTSVAWTGSTVSAWTQNGAAGSAGASGVQSATPTVYQWAATLPEGPIGSATYIWQTGAFGAAPANWNLAPQGVPPAGSTLWAAVVTLTDAATAITRLLDWSDASITARGYAGATGEQGPQGTPGSVTGGNQGVSARIAYAVVTGFSLNSAPLNHPTTGNASFPANNTWGGSEAWGATVPTYSAGQAIFQINGLYNPVTDTTNWGAPYLSALKVGSLSAITINTGALTVNGALTVTAPGSVRGGAFTSYSWPAAGLSGFYLSNEGIMLGNANAVPGQQPRYFQANANGDIYTPAFNVINGVGSFNGITIGANGVMSGIGTAGISVANSLVGSVNMLWGAQNGPHQVNPTVYGIDFASLKAGSSNPFGLRPGEELSVSVDIWQDLVSQSAGQQAVIFLYAQRADNNWTVVAQVGTANLTPTRLSASFVLPTLPDMFNVAVGIYKQGGDNLAGTIFADRVKVERGSVATQYSPGSQPGATIGATWGSNLIDQPADAAVLNVNQQWSQVGGAGRPFDNANATSLIGGVLHNNGASTGVAVANSSITMNANGTLGGAGAGQIQTVPVLDRLPERSTNRPPSFYPTGTTREFKESLAVGLGGSDTFLTLETIIQFQDSSGGAVYQYAYRGNTTWRRAGIAGANSWAGAWVQDLDRNAYTGDLNATFGATQAQQDAITAANNGLTAKLNKSAADVLNAPITLLTSGAIVAGNTTNGVVMAPGGLAGYKNNAVTFSINSANGDVTVRGDITGSTGTFVGSMSTGTATGYDVGTGFIALADGRFRAGTSTQYVRWSGSALEIRLDSAIVYSVPLFGPLYADGGVTAQNGTHSVAAGVELRADGSIWTFGGNSFALIVPVKVSNWRNPNSAGIGADHDVRFDLDAGQSNTYVSNDAAGWTQLNFSRAVSMNHNTTTALFADRSGTYAVRRRSDNVVIGEGRFSLEIIREL